MSHPTFSPTENNTDINQDSASQLYEERRIPTIVTCTLNAPFSITAILGNGLIVHSIWNNPILHSPSNAILFCLALCDLGVGFVVQPLYIIYQTFYITKRWKTWRLAMSAFNVIANFIAGVSFLTTTAVSVERYLAIHLHLRYRELVTIRRTIFLLVVLWITAAFVASTLLWNPRITFLAALAVIVVCLFVTTASYIKMSLIVRSHQRQIQDQVLNQSTADHPSNTLQQIKSAVSMFYICIIHFLCYLPYFVFLILRDSIEKTAFSIVAVEFAQTLVFLNSSFNPAVYCWRLREVRAAVRRTLAVLRFKAFGQ